MTLRVAWARRWSRRLLATLGICVVAAAVLAPSAGAEAVPTNYRTSVTALRWSDGASGGSPPLDERIAVRILGGDAYVELSVSRGSVVDMAGYRAGDEYLRIDAEGVVEVNTSSDAYALNATRFSGTISAGPPADGRAAANWKVVSHSGRYAWHDHRTHWMSSAPPMGVPAWDGRGSAPAASVVTRGTISLVVDGRAAEIETVTHLLASPRPMAWWAVSVGAAFAALVAGRLLGERRWVWTSLLVAVGVAVWALWVIAAHDEPVRWPTWHAAMPLLAVVTLVVGGWRRRPWRETGSLAGLLMVGAGVTVAPTWAAALTPGFGPSVLARFVAAVSLGVGCTMFLSGCWRLMGALKSGGDALAKPVTR